MTELQVRLADGTVVAVPASLDSITAYVLLEQENWFEKDTTLLFRFLRPGMTVIDIGANLGVYSLPMARLVAPHGRVIAYEPAQETCNLLQHSRALNEASGLEIITAALSDTEGQARLMAGTSSELNVLSHSTGERGETVEVTTLDIEDTKRNWPPADFIKIDAEGEEAHILAGGAAFFARHSPLVMFEVKAGPTVNTGLQDAFAEMGYAAYRQLGDAPILVPVDPTASLDEFELNLFAAKPDRAAQLAAENLLTPSIPEGPALPEARHIAWDTFCALPFAGAFGTITAGSRELDRTYADALAAFAYWRDTAAPLPDRCAALQASFRLLGGLCRTAPNSARQSTYARVAWEAGERAACVAALHAFFAEAGTRSFAVTEPFWPACPRYDAVDPADRPMDWLLSAMMEQLERARAHSTLFGGESSALDWLCDRPFASAEMERRRTLLAAKAGKNPVVPDRLRHPAADHLNAELWNSGQIPGTCLAG
jgi:FkbM family methyltransferase